jgi:hypothetical protein
MKWAAGLALASAIMGTWTATAAERLLPSALVCTFKSAHSASFEKGEFSAGTTGDEISLTFASLDAEKNSAQEIGSQGAVPVYYRVGDWELQFVEFTLGGNITTTSVVLPEQYKPFDGRRFGAVHSRHVAIIANDMVISQYLGTCEPRF